MKKLIVLCLIFFILSACTHAKPSKGSRFLLNTIIELTIYDKNSQKLINEIFSDIQDMENRYSRHIPGSEISKINNNPETHVNVSEDTLHLVEKGLYFSSLSDGLFDISIGPLVDLWGINEENPKVPSQAEIDAVVQIVDYHGITIDKENRTIKIAKGMSIDTGAIAKGYITDKLVTTLNEKNVNSAILNLGGNLYLHGAKPDGSFWTIGVRNPFGLQGDYIGTVSVKDMSIVTSGIYERYFDVNEKRYHHILNPKTGYPEDNDLASVSILSPSSTKCDGFSTTVFLLGLSDGMKLIEESNNVEAIMVTKDKKVYLSSGIQNGEIAFKLINKEFTLAN